MFKDFEEIYQTWLPEDVVTTELCRNEYQAFYPIHPEEREIYTLNEELDINPIETDIPPLESELEAMLTNFNLEERNSTPLNDEQIESTQSNARLENSTDRIENLNIYKNILTYAMFTNEFTKRELTNHLYLLFQNNNNNVLLPNIQLLNYNIH